jgi:putative membrane protein
MRITVAAATFLIVACTAASAQQKAPAETVAFAKKAASANSFQIQSSELAQERSQSAEVKSFAKQMVDEHTKIGQDFKDAVQAANNLPALPEQPDAKQKAALAKLRKAQGMAFDRGYLNAQLTGHKEAAALLRRYAKTGRTPQLKEFAQKTLPTVEQNLAEVTDLNRRVIAAGKARPGVGTRAIGPPAERQKQKREKRQ